MVGTPPRDVVKLERERPAGGTVKERLALALELHHVAWRSPDHAGGGGPKFALEAPGVREAPAQGLEHDGGELVVADPHSGARALVAATVTGMEPHAREVVVPAVLLRRVASVGAHGAATGAAAGEPREEERAPASLDLGARFEARLNAVELLAGDDRVVGVALDDRCRLLVLRGGACRAHAVELRRGERVPAPLEAQDHVARVDGAREDRHDTVAGPLAPSGRGDPVGIEPRRDRERRGARLIGVENPPDDRDPLWPVAVEHELPRAVAERVAVGSGPTGVVPRLDGRGEPERDLVTRLHGVLVRTVLEDGPDDVAVRARDRFAVEHGSDLDARLAERVEPEAALQYVEPAEPRDV